MGFHCQAGLHHLSSDYIQHIHRWSISTTYVGLSKDVSKNSKNGTGFVFNIGFPAADICVWEFSWTFSPSKDKTDRTGWCLAAVRQVSTFRFLFQGSRLPVIAWKEEERLKGGVVLLLHICCCSVCPSWNSGEEVESRKRVFQGFVNPLNVQSVVIHIRTQ